MGIKTDYPQLLNALDRMAQAPNLAIYHNIIRQAEETIVQQEQRIQALENLNATQSQRNQGNDKFS
jgi:hypothetical protein